MRKLNRKYFSSAGSTIEKFIELKHALGRKFAVECDVLRHLDQFLYKHRTDLNSESFTAWCRSHQHLTPTVRRNWMRISRNLCLYRRRTKPTCFVPDISLFPARHSPIQPHIFSKTEIVGLFKKIEKFQKTPGLPIRRENFQLALVLLYTAGLRRGELVRLRIGDYGRIERTLLVRESKFHKSRLLPLSKDASCEIENFLKTRRHRGLPVSSDSPLLWNRYSAEGSYNPISMGTLFRNLFKKAGIKTVKGKQPRLHDLRHSFAVHSLLRWYKQGDDVQAKLPLLSIYMGHVSIVSTQYYLQFIDEVVGAANQRFSKQYSSLVTRGAR